MGPMTQEERMVMALRAACPGMVERLTFDEVLAPKLVAALRAAHEYSHPAPFFPYAFDVALRAMRGKQP